MGWRFVTGSCASGNYISCLVKLIIYWALKNIYLLSTVAFFLGCYVCLQALVFLIIYVLVYNAVDMRYRCL